MTCPKCKSVQMTIDNTQGIEIYNCYKCGKQVFPDVGSDRKTKRDNKTWFLPLKQQIRLFFDKINENKLLINKETHYSTQEICSLFIDNLFVSEWVTFNILRSGLIMGKKTNKWIVKGEDIINHQYKEGVE